MGDTTSVTSLTCAWGNASGTTGSGQHEAMTGTGDEVARLIERVGVEARDRGVAEQVNVWAGRWNRGDPEPPNPLIQVLVGHPDRASIVWHEVEHSYQAVDDDLPPLAEDITYERGGQADAMPPEATRVHPATVTQVLTTFLATGTRATDVTWTDLS